MKRTTIQQYEDALKQYQLEVQFALFNFMNKVEPLKDKLIKEKLEEMKKK